MGYHDHNWGNIDFLSTFAHWYWGRRRVGDFSVIVAQMVGTHAYGGAAVPVFMLARDGQVLIEDGTPLTLEASAYAEHPTGTRYPSTLTFDWRGDAGSIRLAITNPAVIESDSLLATLPAWKRHLVRLFINPYFLRFNADATPTLELAEAQGTYTGTVLYEIAAFH